MSDMCHVTFDYIKLLIFARLVPYLSYLTKQLKSHYFHFHKTKVKCHITFSIYLIKPFFHQNGQGDQVEHL